MKTSKFFLLILLMHLSSKAQNKFDLYTIDQGLSQNYIFSVCQDRKGFLWIGTKDGLNRYDGYKFTSYRHEPGTPNSLTENNVSVIFEDSRSRLWIGTNGGGLNMFDRSSEKFTAMLSGSDTSSLSSNFITCVFESREGDLWIGTTDGGLNRIDANSLKVRRIKPPVPAQKGWDFSHIHAICQSDDGRLWIGTAKGGLNCYDPETGKWQNIYCGGNIGGNKGRPDEITTLLWKNGHIWFGCLNGLYKYNIKSRETVCYSMLSSQGRPCIINSIIDGGDKLFISSFQLFADFDIHTRKFSGILEPEGKWFTNAGCRDKSGIFWLGTGGWGLIKFNPGTRVFNTKPGIFLTETQPVALKVLQSHYKKLAPVLLRGRGTEFLSIKRRKNGEYLIATPRGGVIRADSAGRFIEKINSVPAGFSSRTAWAISDAFEDNNGVIWAATAGGLSRYDNNKKVLIYKPVFNERKTGPDYFNKSGGAGYPDLTAYLIDRENIFWLGTPDRGIIRFDPNSNSIKNFLPDNSGRFLSCTNILTIAPDARDAAFLWIGTEGGGLDHFNKNTGVCEHYTTRDGLPNNVVYGILSDDDGCLWMSTNRGLCCFNPEKKLFRNYDVESGLQSNEFNRKEYYKSPDGRMYFG